MSFRHMRLLLFFDLPRYTDKQTKQAGKFRSILIKEGFIMLQESVYCKLALNETALNAIKNKVKLLQPAEGNIILLAITEKQFANMEYLLNKTNINVADSIDRLIII